MDSSDGQSLLKYYPFSATPTSHVARHLDTLTVSAEPPSFYNAPEQNQYDYTSDYPQIPPPMAPSSSSLAYALGRPPQDDSAVYFNNYLAQKTREMTISQPATIAVTPRKRKPVVELYSPSIKRMASSPNMGSPATSVPATPSTTHSSTPRKLAYVAVPLKPWLTPKADNSPDDLGGYGSKSRQRDERAPIEKFVAFLEDIIEAEDSLPADPDFTAPSQYFSSLTTDPAAPLLSPVVIRKLSKYISHVARPTKTLRLGSSPTKKGKGRMNDVDTQLLSRLLRILKRSVRVGENLDPFKSSAAPKNNSPQKKKKGKKGDDAEMEEPLQEKEPTDDDFASMAKDMEIGRDSILAAECIISLLSSDRLPKQLYSEELITLCLSTTKNHLTRIIYPFVEASSASNSSLLLQALLHSSSSHSTLAQANRMLDELFQALSALFPSLNNLLNPGESSGEVPVSMSEEIIIQAVYIAIEPFFVVDSSDATKETKSSVKSKKDGIITRTLGKTPMRGLRLDALALIRSIFAHHESQRSWIIEEILSSLIKLYSANQKAGQFRLRDGRSIRTVSALLMQLVQTTAHDVRLQARSIAKKRRAQVAMRQSESQVSLDGTPEDFLDELDFEEIKVYSTGLEGATKAAKTIVLFLNQRSGKGKATKNSNEQDYRTIFDNLISDVLAVLFWPEWPAATLILGIVVKFMLSSLEDVNTASAQSDNNAAKTIALDHLGIIAAKIKAITLKKEQNTKPIKPLDEITSSLSLKELDRLLSAHHDVAVHLSKRSSDDQAYDSAQELTSAMLGQDLAQALKQVNNWISDPEDEDLNLKDTTNLLTFGQTIKKALKEVWKDKNTDVFDFGSQEEVARVDQVAEQLGSVQTLRNSFQPILNKILQALDAPPIFVRTKALRALGQIITSDATILSAINVRRSIESHLLDSSPAVRDAAVELIGKYMVDRPDVAGDYYQKIADRMADTGLSVRKRVIKLLKSFYGVISDAPRQVDIATRLVLRMVDEDDSVKDLAIKTVEELWFPATAPTKSKTPGKDKGPLLAKVAVIMGVSGNFKDRQSPLEDILHKIISEKEGNDAQAVHAHYTEICETLIDGLVDASDLPGFTVVNCIRTIYLFVSAYPVLLTATNASTLLPYLKNTTMPEEQVTSDYLLKIFRASIPHLPRTAAKFGTELQVMLQPMIIKPSSVGGLAALQETVACMCAVVRYLTHDFGRLIALLKSCNGRLQRAIQRPVAQAIAPNEVKALSILIFIVCLLAEHCDFNSIRDSTLQADLTSISQGSITEHVYNSMLKLHAKYDDTGLRARILQCLGFLFRAQPTLMTLETSADLMDKIFESDDQEAHGRLLKIMQDFLISEATKHAAQEKESASTKRTTKVPSNVPSNVNMEELIGNTDGFADSGVSSAIVQRYLTPILDAALSQNASIQLAAIDILSFTVKQGLAHPLQSFPVIIALETSSSATLSNRAAALHSILHTKHTSLLNTRYIVSARASFTYQAKICGSRENVRGFRLQPSPVALLQRWYSLVREKRPTRQDFLKSLVKVYQERQTHASSQEDVDFARYMTENFAAFEYKTQEEVLTIIKCLTDVLSTTGMALLEILSPSHLLSQIRNPAAQSTTTTTTTSQGGDAMDVDSQARPEVAPKSVEDEIPVFRTSVIIAMVMQLKAYLKNLYGLSEDKCQKFVLNKKSTIGDKAATKRHDKAISWDRLQFALKPLITTEDIGVQKSQFLQIWNEDGVSAEPANDEIVQEKD